MASRGRADNPNDTLEKPVLLELLGDVTGKRILDLGCGDAAFGHEAFQRGCAAYLGVEGSHNMVALALQNLAGTSGRVIEANLETALSHVHQALVASGRFVFSVEHPVITSCHRA